MQYIGISAEPAQTNAKRHGLEIINRADGRFLIDPDGYRWKLIPEAIPSTVHHVSINVSNLDKAIGSSNANLVVFSSQPYLVVLQIFGRGSLE
jgi:hypothetical protein